MRQVAARSRRLDARRGLGRVVSWSRRAVVLAFADLSSLVVAVAVACAVWAVPVRSQPIELYLGLWPLLGLFVLAYSSRGLYPGFGLGGIEIVRRLTLGTSQVFVLLAALDFVFKLPQVYSRMTFAIAWALALVTVPAGRGLAVLMARRWAWWKVRCVILGTGQVARETIAALNRALTLGYRPVAVLAHVGEPGREAICDVPVLGGADEADAIAAQGVEVAILVDSTAAQWTAGDLAHLQTRFRSVLWVHGRGTVPVEGAQLKNLGGVIGVEYINQLFLPRSRALKRAVDLLLGSLLVVLSLPLLVLCALAVRLSSRGPVFFTQEREGLGGERIRIWKLRTMYPDAEARLEEVLATDAVRQAEWESRFKLENDPRIIPGVGTFLRRFSLDELPQFWQVVRGTMSLVGPRPFPSYQLRLFDPETLELRRRVRPGVTGLWQIKVRSTGDVELQQSHDAYYIRNWSLWMDLYVLGRTLGAVLSGRGAE